MTKHTKRVTRVIVIEGDADWVDLTLAKSIVNPSVSYQLASDRIIRETERITADIIDWKA